jgi:hypothetical protein
VCSNSYCKKGTYDGSTKARFFPLEDLRANLQCTKDGLIVSKPVIRLQTILVRITFNRKSYYKTFKSVRSMQCATPYKSLNLNNNG